MSSSKDVSVVKVAFEDEGKWQSTSVSSARIFELDKFSSNCNINRI